jgi:ABC-type uncharacterized transport system ATPase subunit
MIELKSLTKVYGDCVANAGVSLSVRPGSIHAIIGENGAGKSTAMRMLYGMARPDAGEILVDGIARTWRSPSDAIAAGIGMVHQHFMLAGPYDPVDNVVLGAEPAKKGVAGLLPLWFRPIDRSGAKVELQAIAKKNGFAIDWSRPVEELPVGIQQQLEIVKLLYRSARILILDEPTAVLTPQETRELFERLKELRSQGKTILIITHKLKEVMAISDRVTVFRGGRTVGEVETKDTSPEELAQLMVGRRVSLHAAAPPAPVLREPVLEVGMPGLGFQVRGGEVVGIAGVEGNGQSELLRALVRPSEMTAKIRGPIRILGKETANVGRALSTREILALGVSVIPEDRHREGLLLDRPVRENFLLGLQRQPEFSKSGFIQSEALERTAEAALETYDIRPRSLEVSSGSLSGGNQQKVIIAREFTRKPRFLIAAQPTRGVDVGAIEFIHQRILDARAGGTGVLLVSSELDEILALSDRILVMFGGKIVAQYARGQADENQLGLAMGGAT